MSRFRAFILVSAAVVLGACSDDTTSPPDPVGAAPNAAQQQSTQQQNASSGDVVVGVKRGAAAELQSGLGAEHNLRTCNGIRTECITIFHSGNFVGRVLSQAAAQGAGCSRVYFYVNGALRAYSGVVCHNRGDQLYANWYPRRSFAFGSLFRSDWRGSPSSPPGYATQRF
jgi:hypothetical protein